MTGNTTGWVDAGWSQFVSTTSQEDWVPAYSAGGVLGNTWGNAKPGVAWVNYTPRPPHPHECPHCRRDRHDGPLTVRVAAMFDSHQFDPEYDPELDSSPVICVGSDFEGPQTAAAQQVYTYGNPPWAIPVGVSHLSVYEKLIEMWQWPKFEFASEATWYPEEILDVQCETPDVEVEQKVGTIEG